MKFEFDLSAVSRLMIVGVIAVILVSMSFSLFKMDSRSAEKQISNIEQIINKSLVQCYALEGFYPASIDYLEKYGVQFDHNTYNYFYEVFSPTIMPSYSVSFIKTKSK